MLTNGIGEPRYPIAEVKPGSIARFGVDDDMTVIVLANIAPDDKHRELLFYGCFSDEPGSWEQGRLFSQSFLLFETLTIIIPA